MTSVNVDGSADHVAKPRKRGRVVLIVAGALVVVLGVTAGIVIPRIQQAQHAERVEQYTALADQLQGVLDERAEAETTLYAASALGDARHAEVLMAATAVEALGESKEPMLPASHAAALEMVGVSAAEELGPLEEPEEEESPHTALAVAYVETRETEENARNAAIEAGEEEPTAVLPASFAELTVEQAVELIGVPVTPEQASTVAEEDVTDEDIAALQAELAAAEAELEQAEAAVAEQLKRHEAVAAAANIMLPTLQEAAAAIDEFLAAVEEEAAKAEDEVAQKTAAAAERVRESADSTDLSELHGRIAAYVAAGEESLTSHAAVVKAEEEAAEAKRKAEEEAAKKRSSSNAGNKLCYRYVSTWYGGSRTVLTPCR